MPSMRESLEPLLRDREYGEITALARKARRAVRTLVGLLYHDEEIIRWRAITMLGRLAESDPGLVVPFVKRLLWFMNEESSTVGWGSAQAIAEMHRMNPEVAAEAARVVVHFLDDEEVSQPANRNTYILAGSIWAIGALSGREPALVSEMGGKLPAFLKDPDPQVRALAAWALGKLGAAGSSEALGAAVGDPAEAQIYEGEELRSLTVGEAAAAALKSIGG